MDIQIPPKRLRRLLLVEDNPGDIRLTREAIKESGVEIDMQVVSDGELVMDYLMKKGNFIDAVRPELIMLDLNLPKKNGLEILKEIKANDKLRRIPVIAVTTSEADHDVHRAYDLGANAYILKPVDFDDFTRVLQQLENFWFKVVKLAND
ncbi:MAG: response regulator [Chitinophagales bacterium]